MERANHYQGYLKRHILLPLTAVILIAILVLTLTTYWYVKSAIDRESRQQLHYIEQNFQRLIEGEAHKIAGFIELLATDTQLRDALAAQDRNRLLTLASAHYRYLNSAHRISHLYFTGSDRINLLRVHDPSRYGDRIDRITTLHAQENSHLSYGLELGPLGTFTLRVVKPWYHRGSLIGYIELGEEIDHVIDAMRLDLGVELYVLIDKQYLQREQWEKGMQMLQRLPNWEQHRDYILSSSQAIPAEIVPYLLQQNRHSGADTVDRIFDVPMQGRYLKAAFLPLIDAQGRQVGRMLMLIPTEHWILHGQKTVLGATFILLLLGSGAFALFYRLSNNIEQTLDATQRSLLEESQKLSDLQASHIAELEQSNRRLESTSEALRLSHARLEEAQRLAHIGSWEWDIGNNTLIWSNEVYRIFGLPTHTEVTYQTFLTTIPDEDRKRVEEAIAKTLKSAEPYEIEHTILRPDGSHRRVREMGELYCDDNGAPLRMVGTVHDITQYRRAEQASRRLGQIFDHASNEFYLIDATSLQIVQANATASRHLGYSSEELATLNYLDIVTGQKPSQFNKLTAPLLARQSDEVRLEGHHRRKSGEHYPVEVRLQQSHLDAHPHFIAIVLDTSERQQHQEELLHQALHDSLTGLPNRVLLSEQLQLEIAKAKREGVAVTLIQLDLRNFREVNDTLGHDNGDELLRQVAKRLRSAVRESDMVARIAGDEFYLLLSQVGLQEYEGVVRQLQHAMGAPFQIGSYGLNVEFSGGIAIYPEHATDAAQLMRHTDIALTRAKTERSGLELYRPERDPFSVRRLLLNSHMHHAIEHGEFVLYYQPKVESKSRLIRGAEALIRWNHPEYGLLLPEEFIPLAEETGYIRQITLWEIEEAARQLAEWQRLGKHPIISINLSARFLQDPDLFRFINDTVNRHGITRQQLGFEITETTVMRDPDFTLGVLNDLDAMGHPLAIDDYGTGYSSLNYLRRLPAGELKIDISFVQAMLEDDDSAVIVHSTIELAHHLGMRVTAEGVEIRDQADILTILNADLLQGFFFSKPLLAEQFITQVGA